MFCGLKSHIGTQCLRGTMNSIHPFSQALYRLVTFLSAWRECGNKGRGTINMYEDRLCFTSDFDDSMLHANNAPKLSDRRPVTVLF